MIRTAGTNCDAEMCEGFALAGAAVELVHVDKLIAEPALLDRAELVGFPGGFSYGDDIASGRIMAVRLREHLWPTLRALAGRGVPMIAACNGFQTVVQAGLLPGPSVGGAGEAAGAAGGAVVWPEKPTPQSVSLQHNQGGRFIDTWLPVAYDGKSRCVWTAGLAEQYPAELHADVFMLPIGHGEGRFVAASKEELDRLVSGGQVALRYTDNVNGSQDAIAGICDPSGRIFGLMPHPERYLHWHLHPYWTRLPAALRELPTPGMVMFRNAVAAAVAAR